jgi:hypothetical protein
MEATDLMVHTVHPTHSAMFPMALVSTHRAFTMATVASAWVPPMLWAIHTPGSVLTADIP